MLISVFVRQHQLELCIVNAGANADLVVRPNLIDAKIAKGTNNFLVQSAKQKPYYLATTEFIDDEMRQRIVIHQQQRQDRFITI